jgi:hypothetical protein
MRSSTFYPLRKIVSNLIPIKPTAAGEGAILTYKSEKAEELEYNSSTILMSSLNQSSSQSSYIDYLPRFGKIFPGSGMSKLPVENNNSPFEKNNSFLSFSAITKSL